MLNILHLEASPGWGGQEIRILHEAEGMRARGHTVIFAVMQGAALATHARRSGFVTYELNFHRSGWPWTLLRLLWIVRRHAIELVNTHSSLDAWIGGIAARLARKKLLRTRHLSTPVKPGWNSRFVYGTLADFVVTTCAAVIPSLANQSGKERKLFNSIATGVDPARIKVTAKEAAAFRHSLKLADDDFLVGTACFMRSWKGIEDLLEAANRLRHHPQLKWVLIGGGHIERYRDLAAKLELNHLVTFTGHLENPFPAIQALNAFALLSTAHEGVSQAILQAAYLERPLIATSTGGLAEVCIHEVTGLQVPCSSPEAVAEAVLRLLSDASLCSKLGKTAKTLVSERFTFEQTLNEMEAVYQKIANLK